jgi:hypothetical protein
VSATTTYYLDLYNGDPSTTGTSVLATITGSATRTNITSLLAVLPQVGSVITTTNVEAIVVTTESLSQTNISYVALFDAASGGSLLYSAALGASPTIAKGNPVQFNPLQLAISIVV